MTEVVFLDQIQVWLSLLKSDHNVMIYDIMSISIAI